MDKLNINTNFDFWTAKAKEIADEVQSDWRLDYINEYVEKELINYTDEDKLGLLFASEWLPNNKYIFDGGTINLRDSFSNILSQMAYEALEAMVNRAVSGCK